MMSIGSQFECRIDPDPPSANTYAVFEQCLAWLIHAATVSSLLA